MIRQGTKMAGFLPDSSSMIISTVRRPAVVSCNVRFDWSHECSGTYWCADRQTAVRLRRPATLWNAPINTYATAAATVSLSLSLSLYSRTLLSTFSEWTVPAGRPLGTLTILNMFLLCDLAFSFLLSRHSPFYFVTRLRDGHEFWSGHLMTDTRVSQLNFFPSLVVGRYTIIK